MKEYRKTYDCLIWGLLFLGFINTGSARTIYVKHGAAAINNGTSWADAYGDLQSALDAAEISDQIWVAAGTYFPTYDYGIGPQDPGPDNPYNHFRLKNGVEVYGGFAGDEDALDQRDIENNETILSGDIGVADDSSDNCYHVFFNSNTFGGTALDATAVLDGFTITAANANAEIWPHNSGGGMYNEECSPTVANCTFSGNTAYDWGGGMANDIIADPVVTDCTFSGNDAFNGGGIANYDSSPDVMDCTFTNNTAESSGGGMFNELSTPNVENCDFSSNTAFYGGGVYNLECSPTVTSCTFSGNSATEGGGLVNEYLSDAVITNCIFSGNSAASYGGGMENYDICDPIVTNCTFSGNDAEFGGAMDNYGSNPLIYNSIFWGNIAAANNDQVNNELGVPVIASCDIQGGLPVGSVDDGGNLNAAPMFVDADGPDDIFGTEDDDLQLQKGSPCIDAGNNSVVTETTDIKGDQRIMNGDHDSPAIVDMGAFEYHPSDIEVNPLVCDFGEVEVGSAGSVIVTISNVGNADLVVNLLDLSLDNEDYYILNPATLPFIIAPKSLYEVEVIFEPSVEFLSLSTLFIGSDDIDEPMVEVQLGGVGLLTELTPSEQIANILNYIDTSEADGSLTGNGPGGSEKNGIKTFTKKVEKIQKHIDQELYQPAANMIDAALKRCDGESSSAFVGGPAVEELASMLLQLKADLQGDDIAEIVSVVDERHMFIAAGSLRFELEQLNIDPAAIIVWDAARTKIYFDYNLLQTNGATEILIIPGGDIFSDGDQVLSVDYDYVGL